MTQYDARLAKWRRAAEREVAKPNFMQRDIGPVDPVTLLHLLDRVDGALAVLDDAFGHADAPHTPAALEAIAILRGEVPYDDPYWSDTFTPEATPTGGSADA